MRPELPWAAVVLLGLLGRPGQGQRNGYGLGPDDASLAHNQTVRGKGRQGLISANRSTVTSSLTKRG